MSRSYQSQLILSAREVENIIDEKHMKGNKTNAYDSMSMWCRGHMAVRDGVQHIIVVTWQCVTRTPHHSDHMAVRDAYTTS